MHVAPDSCRPLRELRLGREMQVGEQRLALAQQPDLDGLGLLDLQHELGLGEHGLGVGHDLRALRREVRVLERAAQPRTGLHQHLVPARAQLAHPRGGDRHAVLVGLHLGRDADPHRANSLPRSASQNSIRSRAWEKSRPVSCSTRRMR